MPVAALLGREIDDSRTPCEGSEEASLEQVGSIGFS